MWILIAVRVGAAFRAQADGLTVHKVSRGLTPGTSFGVAESYAGNMQVVLFGNKGNTMRCKFQYADSSGYTTSGGIGLCETSDGRVADVLWLLSIRHCVSRQVGTVGRSATKPRNDSFWPILLKKSVLENPVLSCCKNWQNYLR